MPGHAGTRLPFERERACRVAHLFGFRKASTLCFTYLSVNARSSFKGEDCGMKESNVLLCGGPAQAVEKTRPLACQRRTRIS